MTIIDQTIPVDLLTKLQSFKRPYDIQEFLDQTPYVSEELDRSPLRVYHDRQCHCLDGAIFAALGFHFIGLKPLLVDLVPAAGLDDDHVLAVFQVGKFWGAVAKSNFAGLRYREPVYRTLRELAMSYFEDFFNVAGLKTMRGYTVPLDLTRFNRYQWATEETGIQHITRSLYRLKPIPVLSETQVSNLEKTDPRSYQAGLVGVNEDGLFRPGRSDH